MDKDTTRFIKGALLPIKYVDTNGETKVIDPEKILSFDPENIKFEDHAKEYYLVARLAERQRVVVRDFSAKMEALKSNLYTKYLNDASLRSQNNNKKPTESMLLAAINSDKAWLLASHQYNLLDQTFRELDWLRKAIESKASLMQSASAEKRSEQNMVVTGKIK